MDALMLDGNAVAAAFDTRLPLIGRVAGQKV